jgi:hypothetical protein
MTLWQEWPTRNDACILADDYRGPRGRVDKQFQPWSSNDSWNFATEVANKKQRLHSSQQLTWSSRMGWQTVSTTIFEWLLNLWLKMWTNYRIVVADNLLEGRTGVANKKRRLRSSQRLPTDLFQSNSMLQNSIQTSINYTSTNLSNQCEMRRENPVSC